MKEYTPWQIEHKYGEDVYIFSNPLTLSLLAQIGSPETEQPLLNLLVKRVYDFLLSESVSLFFPKKHSSVPTRMQAIQPEGVYQGDIIDRDVRAICVDLARAGTYPSHLCYELLNYLLKPSLVRQDHFYVARKADSTGKLIGVDVSGSKIGGDKEGAVVLFPDPMGASGSTIVQVYNHYKNEVPGHEKLMVAIHLIVTPEYIKRVTKACPGLKIVAGRVDRGLSSPDVLKSVPGTYLDQEKGLNDHSYIVPGAGGLGEVLNNSFC